MVDVHIKYWQQFVIRIELKDFYLVLSSSVSVHFQGSFSINLNTILKACYPPVCSHSSPGKWSFIFRNSFVVEIEWMTTYLCLFIPEMNQNANLIKITFYEQAMQRLIVRCLILESIRWQLYKQLRDVEYCSGEAIRVIIRSINRH